MTIDGLVQVDVEKNKSNFTLAVFKSRLNVIHKFVYNQPLQEISTIDVFLDYKRVIKVIDECGNKSKIPFYGALIKVFSHYKEKAGLDCEEEKAFLEYKKKNLYYRNLQYIEKYNLEFKTIEDVEVKNLITAKSIEEERNWIDYEELTGLYLDTLETFDLMDSFLIQLFLFLPVERHCFKSLKVYKANSIYDEKENVLIIDDDNNPLFIILKDFKTKGKYDEIVIDIGKYNNEENCIRDNFKFYIESKGIKNGDFLFDMECRKEFGNRVKNAFKKLCGKPISINMLRKIYVSDNWKFSRDKDEMIEDAMILGHDISTEMTEYIKI